MVEKLREKANVSYEEAKGTQSSSLGSAIRRFFCICLENSFCVAHKEKTVFQLPLIAAVIILLFTWKFTIPLMLVSLFFGIRYSFAGKDDLQEANRFMDTAGNVADNIKEGFMNGGDTVEE